MQSLGRVIEYSNKYSHISDEKNKKNPQKGIFYFSLFVPMYDFNLFAI